MGSACQKQGLSFKSIDMIEDAEEKVPLIQSIGVSIKTPLNSKQEFFEDGVYVDSISQIIIKPKQKDKKDLLNEICQLKKYGASLILIQRENSIKRLSPQKTNSQKSQHLIYSPIIKHVHFNTPIETTPTMRRIQSDLQFKL